MRVGFLSNQLDNRGTGNAIFDYAHYNQSLLKNESKIFTFASGDHSPLAIKRFENRFKEINYIDSPQDIIDIDVLYHIKYGNDDGFRPNSSIRYAVHGVFEIEPHGDRYAAVSKWLANSHGLKNFVPHIVDTIWSNESYRTQLEIPENHFVVGRHGGYDTFDIDFAWDGISETLEILDDVHFVFLNTAPKLNHARIHYLPEGGPLEKRIFLNTCNAMLHARSRGETFGIAVGEFGIFGKPVITYALSPERAHIEELGDKGLYYLKANDIYNHIYDLVTNRIPRERFTYMQHSYTAVMKQFKEIFLD